MFSDYPQLHSEFEAILSFMICVNTHPRHNSYKYMHIYHTSAYTHRYTRMDKDVKASLTTCSCHLQASQCHLSITVTSHLAPYDNLADGILGDLGKTHVCLSICLSFLLS